MENARMEKAFEPKPPLSSQVNEGGGIQRRDVLLFWLPSAFESCLKTKVGLD